MTAPTLGCTKNLLDTPALCLDLDKLERNIGKVAATCRNHNVAWRPHCKGHKVPQIAKREIDAGAIGVTCAKLGEAEVMAEAGIGDLLIANMIAGEEKVRRLVALRRKADSIVAVDHPDQVQPISQAMHESGLKQRLLIEVDFGLNRVGVQPGEPALELARAIHELPGVELAGVMGYEGHLLTVLNLDEKRERIHEALGQLTATADLLRENDLPCPIVSCGGTGSYQISVAVPGITEVQAGGAVYMDAYYHDKCQVRGLEFALTVQVTVVSRPTPDRAIIDAGRKALNIEVHTPQVVGRKDIEVVRLSAEHGELKLAPSARKLRIGDRLEIIPGYGDLTTVLHNEFFGLRGSQLECIWPLVARGRLQ